MRQDSVVYVCMPKLAKEAGRGRPGPVAVGPPAGLGLGQVGPVVPCEGLSTRGAGYLGLGPIELNISIITT